MYMHACIASSRHSRPGLEAKWLPDMHAHYTQRMYVRNMASMSSSAGDHDMNMMSRVIVDSVTSALEELFDETERR